MAARDGRRFEFGWLEVVGLILIFAGGSAVVFFLGMFVGKGLQESRLQREERIVRVPVSPSGSGRTETGGDNEVRLADELARSAAAPSAGVALAVRRSASGAPGTETRAGAPGAQTAPAPGATPEPSRQLGAVPGVPGVRGVSGVPASTDEVTSASPAPSPAVKLGERPEDGGRIARGRGWSVQVNATRDEGTANGLVRRLSDRGYNAYIVRVGLQGDTWYRVRVGRFPTMEAATAVVMRLKNEERHPRAFLVND